MVVAKIEAAGLHSFEIPTGVILFLLQGAEDAFAEGVGGVGEFEEGQSHELHGEELVICEKMKEDAALFFVVNVIPARERGFSVIGSGF